MRRCHGTAIKKGGRMAEGLLIHCPIYLLRSMQACGKCGTSQSVVALAAHHVSDENEKPASLNPQRLTLLIHIEAMPAELFAEVNRRHPRYVKRQSVTNDFIYYANTCECSANFDDYYLYSQPGGAFCPASLEGIERISRTALLAKGSLKLRCGYVEGPPSAEYVDPHRNCS